MSAVGVAAITSMTKVPLTYRMASFLKQLMISPDLVSWAEMNVMMMSRTNTVLCVKHASFHRQ